MDKSGKIWGITSEIFTNDTTSIHRIEIKPNLSCSKHLHKYKYNMFFIEKGKILLKKWDSNNLFTQIILTTGDSTTVPPNTYHQFTAIENTIIYEIYFSKLDNQDIVRDIDVVK